MGIAGNVQSPCRKSISIREGTLFEQTRITLQKWLILIYWWVREYAVRITEDMRQVERFGYLDL